MILDRLYQFALFWIALILLWLKAPDVFLFILAGLVALSAGIAFFVLIPYMAWFALAYLLAPPRDRALMQLRQARGDRARGRAALKIVKAFGLSGQDETQFPDLMQRSARIDTWLPPIFERPLTAEIVAQALAGPLAVPPGKLRISLAIATAREENQGPWRRLRRGRNRLLSRLAGSAAEIARLEEVASILPFGGPNPRRKALAEALQDALIAQGLNPFIGHPKPIRALAPRQLRCIVLLLRLAEDESRVWQMRFTDPDLARRLQAIAHDFATRMPRPVPSPPPPTAERAAIQLRRTWPVSEPISEPGSGQSWLGGLPMLPQGQPWPRRSHSGQPLHFLAQVDCASLPRVQTDTPLPGNGLLLFFADMNDDALDPPDAIRVIHVPQARRPQDPAALPPNLLPQRWAQRNGQRSYPRWPLVAQPMRCLPMGEFAPDDAARQRAKDLKTSELARLFPEAPAETYPRFIEQKGPEHRWVEGLATDPGFPFCGAVVKGFAQAILSESAGHLAKAEAEFARGFRPEQAVARLPGLRRSHDAARDFAAWADSLDDLSPPQPDQVARFQSFALAQCMSANTALRQVFTDLARASVTNPALARILPPEPLIALTPRPVCGEHVMLGYPQAVTNSTRAEGVRLLVLESDPGVNFMFADCGVIEFYIPPEDLARQDFSRVVALMNGG